MTVGEFKALLEDSAIDAFGELKFYDNQGNVQQATIRVVGSAKSVLPSQPADPGYTICQLEPPAA